MADTHDTTVPAHSDGSRRGLNRQQAEPLLRERAAITQSSRAADDVLECVLCVGCRGRRSRSPHSAGFAVA